MRCTLCWSNFRGQTRTAFAYLAGYALDVQKGITHTTVWMYEYTSKTIHSVDDKDFPLVRTRGHVLFDQHPIPPSTWQRLRLSSHKTACWIIYLERQMESNKKVKRDGLCRWDGGERPAQRRRISALWGVCPHPWPARSAKVVCVWCC